MSEIEKYEILILGSGEAGKYLAWTMAKAGRRTALVERRFIGGSCPNIACLPSKNVIHSAKVASLLRRASEFGITTGPLAIDMAGVRQRKRKMVDDLIAIHLDRYKASGTELILGEGRFLAPRTIEVRLKDGGTRLLVARQHHAPAARPARTACCTGGSPARSAGSAPPGSSRPCRCSGRRRSW